MSEKFCVMTLKGDAKFKGKLNCGLKNHTKSLVDFHGSSRKSENVHFGGSFCPKHIKFYMKNYWEWCKVWSKTDSWLYKTLEIWWILMPAAASPKIFFLIYYFCQKHKKFQQKKYVRVISNSTEEWFKLWGKTDLLFEKWHEKFGEF